MIFLFSVALAYFTANYVSSGNYFDYWGTLAIFGGVYIVIGIAVSMILSVSLGFLFAADVLIVHLMLEYYGQWADVLKLVLVGTILVVLYICAAFLMKDQPALLAVSTDTSPAPVPPVQ